MIPKTKLKTAATTVPVSLARVKNFLRLDTTDDDALVTVQIKAATSRLELLCDTRFCTQTWDVYFDSFGCRQKDQWWDGTRDGAMSVLFDYKTGKLKMPFGPMQSVAGVYTYDDSDVEYEFPSTEYSTDTISRLGAVSLKNGSSWPSTVLRTVNGIRVEGVFGFGAGYIIGDSASTDNTTIPAEIQEAVKQFTAVLYEHRGDELPVVPPSVLLLIEPYRTLKIG